MPTNKPLLPSYSALSHVDVEVVLLPVPWVGRLKVYKKVVLGRTYLEKVLTVKVRRLC